MNTINAVELGGRGQTTPERRERGRNHADAVELGGLGGHSANPTYPVSTRPTK